jgi:hypothetical protein
MMKRRRITIILLSLVLFLALSVGLSQAQGTQPPAGEVAVEDEARVVAVVSSRIPIQGRLTNASGELLDGDYNIRFRLYNDLDEVLCEDTHLVTSTDGLFNTYIDGCTSMDVSGQQLYLGIKVGTDEEMMERQPIYSVPYALSLRPGAIIQDTNSYVELNRYDSGAIPTSYGLYATANIGLWGESTGQTGVKGTSTSGFGVNGTSSSNAGVRGYSDSGPGVFGMSETGIGMQGVSTDDYGGHFTGSGGVYAESNDSRAALHAVSYLQDSLAILATGDVVQTVAGNGLVKAGVFAYCGETGSQIHRYFNAMPAGASFTITNGAGPGQCTIDFSLNLDERYIVVSASTTGTTLLPRGVILRNAAGSTAEFFRFNTTSGEGRDGDIVVIVY